VATFSFTSSQANALRLVNPTQYSARDYPGGVMTYSFWGQTANGTQGTAEGRSGGYQLNNGNPVRYFLNVPADIRTTVEEQLANISKFINLTFTRVDDSGFEYSRDRDRSQRGRIRIMIDGNGDSLGSAHMPHALGAGAHPGETFYRPWPNGTRSTTGVQRKERWTRQGQTLVSSTNYLCDLIIHELQHSLGLGHGHDAGTGINGVFTEHSPETDNVWNTVQSYNRPLGTGEEGDRGAIIATSMPDDIAGLQSIYGSKNFNHANTTYTFSRGDLYLADSNQQLLDSRIVAARTANINTLDDSGGYDTIDCSGLDSEFVAEGVRIDMNPGGYIISKNDWLNTVSYTDNWGNQNGEEVTGVPRKGTRLSWRTTIEKCQGTERGADTIIGNIADNWIAGYGGNDFLQGLNGNDTLIGGPGADHFFGGAGADLIYLGRGGGEQDADRDRVDFTAASESTQAAPDRVYGFGANDIFDLNDIDANTRIAGKQIFAFIGTAAFSGTAGQLRAAAASGIGTKGFIQADLNGDRVADFSVALTGDSMLATNLTMSNFVLR